MKKSVIAATLIAFAMTTPLTFAQSTPTASQATSSNSSPGMGPGNAMMGGNGHGMMGGHPMMGDHAMMGGNGHGMMGGHPMMGDHGMMGGPGAGMMGVRMYDALDLTDQQRAKIARIFEDTRKKNWDAMGKVMDESATLRDLYNAPTHDPAAIGRQTVKIAEVRRPIIESMVTAHDQIDALLTSEQKERLHSFGHGRMAPNY